MKVIELIAFSFLGFYAWSTGNIISSDAIEKMGNAAATACSGVTNCPHFNMGMSTIVLFGISITGICHALFGLFGKLES